MKTTKGIILFCLVLFVGYSCNTKSDKGNDSPTNPRILESEDPTPITSEKKTTAICLWPKVGLRNNPGRKNTKYLTTIYFGETVEFLNVKEKAEDDKEYIKVKLSDGSEGWVNEYLFAIGGRMAIVKNETELYKRPDIMTFEGKKLEPMDMVVLFEEEEHDGWHQIASLKREKNGWVQEGMDIIEDNLDIKMGILYWRALEETGEKKFELLENILDNPNFKKAKLIDNVSKALYQNEGAEDAFYIDELDKFENLSTNKLGIISTVTNVRGNPTIDADNVLFQVKKGDICDIIEQGASLEEINNRTDRWYKINFNGQEGWVFGYNTTKKRN